MLLLEVGHDVCRSRTTQPGYCSARVSCCGTVVSRLKCRAYVRSHVGETNRVLTLPQSSDHSPAQNLAKDCMCCLFRLLLSGCWWPLIRLLYKTTGRSVGSCCHSQVRKPTVMAVDETDRLRWADTHIKPCP